MFVCIYVYVYKHDINMCERKYIQIPIYMQNSILITQNFRDGVNRVKEKKYRQGKFD
jgi:hypothetical protein